MQAAAQAQKNPAGVDWRRRGFCFAAGVAHSVALLEGFEIRLPPESLLARRANW